MEDGATSQSVDVLFVSRGRGRGHAVPDMAIAKELETLLPGVRMGFVSYAAGADSYRACGYDVTDVRKPDDAPFSEMVTTFGRLFGKMRPLPQLVVSHEEFPVLPAAEIFDIPCVFITDFFTDPTNTAMQVLKYAREILFTGEQGLYTEPPYLHGRVHYVGRAVRPFDYTLADRHRARVELGIPLDATVVFVQPGGWTEQRVPIVDLLIAAWDRLAYALKRLIWLAGSDYEGLHSRIGQRTDVMLLREDWNMDRLMAASNLLITKANRLTVYEAASLGLPSISISSLLNWPDDVAVLHVASNAALVAETTTPEVLMKALAHGIDSQPRPAREVSGGVHGAAERLAHCLDRVQV